MGYIHRVIPVVVNNSIQPENIVLSQLNTALYVIAALILSQDIMFT